MDFIDILGSFQIPIFEVITHIYVHKYHDISLTHQQNISVVKMELPSSIL